MGRLFYSWSARRNLKKLLQTWQPDIVHLHNIYHQISPSIISLLKKRKIPIVMTVHDYYLINPNYNLFHNGQIFDPTKKELYYQVLKNKAIKNSFLASAIDVLAHYFQQRLYRKIDCFICPSQYLATRLQEFYPKNRIVVIPNFTLKPAQLFSPSNYYLYVGRLSVEKGLRTFLTVAQRLPQHNFLVVGDGWEKEILQKEFPIINVQWLGKQDADKIPALIGQAKALIIPSQWPENCPLVILESFASGTPVLATKMGGNSELVKDQESGLLWTAGDADDLYHKIDLLNNDEQLLKKLRQGASNSFTHYTFAIYYQKLLSVYEDLLSNN